MNMYFYFSYDEFDGSQIDGISNLVEHPMQLRPPSKYSILLST